MMEVFNQSPKVTIDQVLANRDRRVALQSQLVDQGAPTVVAIKLNIPGPVKNGDLIRQYFVEVTKRFEGILVQQGWNFNLAESELDLVTGPESFYLVQADARAVKKVTTSFEESQADRRLLDIDVLCKLEGSIQSLSRSDLNLPARTCLICGRLAKDCGRSRRHSVAELQAKVAELIQGALSWQLPYVMEKSWMFGLMELGSPSWWFMALGATNRSGRINGR